MGCCSPGHFILHCLSSNSDTRWYGCVSALRCVLIQLWIDLNFSDALLSSNHSRPQVDSEWPYCDVSLNHQCLNTLLWNKFCWFTKVPPAQPAVPFPWSISDLWVLLYGIHLSPFSISEIRKILCPGSKAPNPPDSSAMVAQSDFNPFLH